jgi:TRAP-type mannitol/chloroaromatic compound transport system permease small subunit
VISALNALVRKVFNTSSNAYLEVQWYLFAGAFLLAAGYTLLNGEHVKIDVVSSRLSKRKQIWIDIIGFVVFLRRCAWSSCTSASPSSCRASAPARCRPTPAA